VINLLDTTGDWIRNRSDELAAEAGYRFNEARAVFTVWWIERYCSLYEGAWAGMPLRLHGAKQVDDDFPIDREEPWDEQAQANALDRAEAYREFYRDNGRDAVDWQYDVTMRLFGWEGWSEKWNDYVRRFRRGGVWCAKKQKKSPTGAAWALYLMAGDGEMGQHVFIGATDGKQAREIIGEHVMAMVEQSPELDARQGGECGINLSKMRISHPGSRSYLQPLSSSNERTQKTQEGRNGSLVIDETHVVYGTFISRIERMGISRKEPMHLELSTSGDDPESYGRGRYDYGKRVAAGSEINHREFFECYEAPQNLGAGELAEDPLKYGRMANPAWGHTIDPEEYLQDYRQSLATSRLVFAEFKKYRLNIWQQSAEPWLRLDDWAKGEREFSVAELYGRECWAAVDFSRTRDMTALCLAFPEEDEAIRLIWWFWLPQQYAYDNRGRAPFMEFAADPRCNFILTPGEVIEPGSIVTTCHELNDRFDIQQIAYDDWNAELITQQISEGIRHPQTNAIILKGTRIPREKFSQGIQQFNEPTKEFERRVIQGKILHNGDPCMTWQVQHATLRQDANNNIKPVKPKEGDVRKVDGLITGVMAMQRAIAAPRKGSIYQTRGILTV